MAEEKETFDIENAPAYERKPESKKKEKFFTPKVIILSVICVGLLIGLIVSAGNKKTVVKEIEIFVTQKVNDIQHEVTTTLAPTTAPKLNGTWSSYRLPNFVIPSHYKLLLHPNLTTEMYTGEVTITLTITQKTNSIVLHSVGLSITIAVIVKGSVATDLSQHIAYDEYDYYEMKSPDITFEPGEYQLILHFNGSLGGKINGFYKSKYLDLETGVESAIVSADMEPMDARKAFPCFDEPSMKAKYTVTIVHDSDVFALSNMDVKDVRDRGNGVTETEFNTTPAPMSTYLTCFVVCNYSYVEATSKRGIPLRVYADKHKIDSGRADYAIKVTKIVFDHFEELFDMNYHFPKLDQIAIPDFSSGAMENWGLITYRHTALLWDSKKSSAENKQRVANVIAHELVHMWFGNTVTMKWWNNLWLNEGFASYFEYFGVDKAEPSWNMFDQIVAVDMKRAMAYDDEENSRPLVPNITSITTKVNASGQFDDIPYAKGASVIRMISDMLGKDVFIDGLRRYLKKFQFKNTDEHDLFAMWQLVCDERNIQVNVAEMLNPWFLQMGYPVLTITRQSSNTINVNQQRFLSSYSQTDLPTELDYKWNVPVNYAIDGVKTQLTFKSDQEYISLKGVQDNQKIKFNYGQFGYYIVNYDPITWTKIALRLELDHSEYSVRDRAGFIHDGFKLAISNRLDYSTAMDITKYLDREDSYVVWKTFSPYCLFLSSRMSDSKHYDVLKKYFLEKLKPHAGKLGWKSSENHLDNLKRTVIISLSLRFGDEAALAEAKRQFQSWIKDENFEIIPNLRSLVYSYGMREAGTEEWAVMFERFLMEDEDNERTRLLQGVTSTKNVTLIGKFLESTKDTSIIKQQDLFTAIAYASWSDVGNRMTWSWLRYNWNFLVERFGAGSRSLNRLVPYVAGGFSTEIGLWELESFYSSLSDSMIGADDIKGQAVAKIKKRITWFEENEQVIASWLAKYYMP